MATVPLSPGTTNLSVNVDVRLREELGKLAKRERVSLSEYVRRILIYAAKHGARLDDGVVFADTEAAALNETKAPPQPPPSPPNAPRDYKVQRK